MPSAPTTRTLPLPTPLTEEQGHYLDGFFAGIAQRGATFAIAAAPAPVALVEEELTPEERIKRVEHPLDSFHQLVDAAAADAAPSKVQIFRFKWNGLFYLTPVEGAYMARLRIPAGQIRSHQLRELAAITDELTTGYVQVTTRANLQIRLIAPKDTPEVLRRIQAIGLHTRGAGADNIRNLTATPTFGIDPDELIDVSPFVLELGHFILQHREFYDLPRKFNIAFDGGGVVGAVEDTNDIGVRAVRVGANADGVAPGIYFRIALGGATGHKAFARDAGILVSPAEIVRVCAALLRVFIAKGNRTDRKRARLKHLLEALSIPAFLAEAEKLLSTPLLRSECERDARGAERAHSHVGVLAQRQPGLVCLGITLPAGQLTSAQMRTLAALAERHGSGELRLTVWQNVLLPNVPEAEATAVAAQLRPVGLDIRQSNVASGIIACTGSRYCKFAQSDTKAHALALGAFLEEHITLDEPVNIHFTGCPHSCAQHYMGDIGLLGMKANVEGENVDAYSVFVGGGFGTHQAVGRALWTAVPFEELRGRLLHLLRVFLAHRAPGERFQAFTQRHDLAALLSLVPVA